MDSTLRISHTLPLLLLLGALQAAQARLVQLPTGAGLVRGLELPLASADATTNHSVYKFLSIPYARPPVGPLRFQRPVELATDERQLVDATKFGPTCAQHRHLARFISPLLNLDHEHQVHEDCLHLSVYVPESALKRAQADDTLEPVARLPVIVWIPGEGFDFADARQFDGAQLAARTQSLVVSVQYRVGLLGFLSAPMLNITGNMGLYDQLAALKWVQRHIAAFGGDEERVTLMGRFSGAMSISALITGPNLAAHTERPLFSRAVLLSGLAVADWIIERSPQGQAHLLAQVEREALGRNFCSAEQVAIGQCLTRLPLERLLAISSYGWKLVADGELVATLDPIEALAREPHRLARGLEAVALGETDTEGTLCLYRHQLDARTNYAQLIEENLLTPAHLYEMIRDDSQTYFNYNLTQANPMRAALEAISAPAQQDEAELRAKYLDACSSYMVKAHNARFRRHLEARNRQLERPEAAGGPHKPVQVHHFSLKYKPSFSLAPAYIRTAAHGDDVPLIFGLVHNQARGSAQSADLLATHKLMSYVGNFVHGNHPLLQQHNSIDQMSASRSGDEPARRPTSWAAPAVQLHAIDLNEAELAAEWPQNDSRERDLSKLLATQTTTSSSQLRVVLMDGQQVLVALTSDQGANQVEGVTRSQKLLELQRRAGSSWSLQQRSQLLLATSEGATGEPATNFGRHGGAELSPVSLVLLVTAPVVLTLMAVCMALSVIVIRGYNCSLAAHTGGPSGHSLVHGAAAGRQSAGDSRRFDGSSPSCNICADDAHLSTGAHKKADERPFCNVFAKLRHQQPRPSATPSGQAGAPSDLAP